MPAAIEYVYHLNLPAAKNIFLDTFNGFNDDDLTVNYQYRTDVDQILKPEWVNFCGIKWDLILYFKKNDQAGEIHTDLMPEKNNLVNPDNSPTPFGINWVWGGPGLFEYWNYTDVKLKSITAGADNTSNGMVRSYNQINEPFKTYIMQEDCAYLTHGGLPHRATGYPGRKLLSLRTKWLKGFSWIDLVRFFNSKIKNANLC